MKLQNYQNSSYTSDNSDTWLTGSIFIMICICLEAYSWLYIDTWNLIVDHMQVHPPACSCGGANTVGSLSSLKSISKRTKKSKS